MQLMSEYTTWENFFAVRVGEAEAQEAQDEKRHDVELSKTIMMLRPDSDNVTEARAKAKIHPTVTMTADAVATSHAHRKALEIQRDNVHRLAQVVSRELSRRIGRDPVQRRTDRWST